MSSKSKKVQKGITNDQFYTKLEISIKLVEIVKTFPWFNNIERIVEPSAGNGSFSNLFEHCLSFDLEPQHPSIKKADFLEMVIEPGPVTLSIGNPPFGRQSSLALKFIKKCAEFSDYIAFILPRSFEKQSMQNKTPLSHSLLYSETLPECSFFLADQSDYNVPSVFQVWERRPRQKTVQKKNSKWFQWTTKEDGDIAIRRVGYYAGTAFQGEEYDKSSPVSHYYIKVEKTLIPFVLDRFHAIEWEKKSDSVAGPRSLSKPEVVDLFDASPH